MRKHLLWFFLLICTPIVSAESIDALILHMASGKQVTYLLNEKPLVSFKGKELVISTSENTVRYQACDVIKFTYSSNSASIVDASNKSDVLFKFENDVLHTYNLEPLSKISIYTIEGKLVASDTAGLNGEVTISVPQSSGCVFLVKTSAANFKLIKP